MFSNLTWESAVNSGSVNLLRLLGHRNIRCTREGSSETQSTAVGPVLLDRCCRRRKGEIKGIRTPKSCVTEPAPVSASLRNDNASETLGISFRGDTSTYSCCTAEGCPKCPALSRRGALWRVISSNRDLRLLPRPADSPVPEVQSAAGSAAGGEEGLQGAAELRCGAVRRCLSPRFSPSQAHPVLSGRCFDSPDKIFPQNTPETLEAPRPGTLPRPRCQESLACPAAGHRRGSGGSGTGNDPPSVSGAKPGAGDGTHTRGRCHRRHREEGTGDPRSCTAAARGPQPAATLNENSQGKQGRK